MKALLTSSFRYMGKFFVPKLNLDNKKNLTCLFIGYALQDKDHINMCKQVLLDNLPIEKFIYLDKEYDFADKIDIVFVNGGLPKDLISKLYQYNQFEKIKKLIYEQGAIYIGESCGSDIAGDYDNYSVLPDFPMDKELIVSYGSQIYNGFRFINKLVLTHACKYRVRKMDNDIYFRSHYEDQYKSYLKYLRILKKAQIDYVTIANNEAILIENGTFKKLKYDWSKWPIKQIQLTEQEMKLKEKVFGKK